MPEKIDLNTTLLMEKVTLPSNKNKYVVAFLNLTYMCVCNM